MFVAQRKEKRETVVRGGGGGGGGGVNVHTRTTIIQTFTHFINFDATKSQIKKNFSSAYQQGIT